MQIDHKSSLTLTQALVARLAEFRPEALPRVALDEAARRIVDSLACGYGALDEVAARATLRAVASVGGTPECTVIGQSWKTSAGNAALANGTLVRCLDLNDLGIGVRQAGHPSDNIPVALAMGERLNSTGRDVLAAIVLGYEIYGRIPTPGPKPMQNWHPAGNSAIVTAAMCGYLMKLDAEALTSAIGLSISQTSSLGAASNGVGGKATANAIVTYTAIMQTLLAAEGVTGPVAAIEDYSRLVCAGADLGALARPLNGPEFLITDAGIKAHPAIGTAQTAVEAALQARADLGDGLAEVDHIEARMADVPFVREQVERAGDLPHSREAADHSFAFLIAVCVLDGKLTLQQFANERWRDPRVVALMERISIKVDQSLNRYAGIGSFPCGITITTHDGKQRSAEVPYHPGHVRNRMGWEGVEAKFHRWVEPHVPAAKRLAIVAAAKHLADASSIRDLMSLVASSVNS